MSEYVSIVIKMILVICIIFGLALAITNAYAIDKEFRKCNCVFLIVVLQLCSNHINLVCILYTF